MRAIWHDPRFKVMRIRNSTKLWVICVCLYFVNSLEVWKGLVRSSVFTETSEDFIIES